MTIKIPRETSRPLLIWKSWPKIFKTNVKYSILTKVRCDFNWRTISRFEISVFSEWHDVSLVVSMILIGILTLVCIYLLCKISKITSAMTIIPKAYGASLGDSQPSEQPAVAHPNFLIYEKPAGPT